MNILSQQPSCGHHEGAVARDGRAGRQAVLPEIGGERPTIGPGGRQQNVCGCPLFGARHLRSFGGIFDRTCVKPLDVASHDVAGRFAECGPVKWKRKLSVQGDGSLRGHAFCASSWYSVVVVFNAWIGLRGIRRLPPARKGSTSVRPFGTSRPTIRGGIQVRQRPLSRGLVVLQGGQALKLLQRVGIVKRRWRVLPEMPISTSWQCLEMSMATSGVPAIQTAGGHERRPLSVVVYAKPWLRPETRSWPPAALSGGRRAWPRPTNSVSSRRAMGPSSPRPRS